MLDWFQRLMPHTQLFFPLFERHATAVTAATEALRQMLEGGEQVSQHCRDGRRLRPRADRWRDRRHAACPCHVR